MLKPAVEAGAEDNRDLVEAIISESPLAGELHTLPVQGQRRCTEQMERNKSLKLSK